MATQPSSRSSEQRSRHPQRDSEGLVAPAGGPTRTRRRGGSSQVGSEMDYPHRRSAPVVSAQSDAPVAATGSALSTPRPVSRRPAAARLPGRPPALRSSTQSGQKPEPDGPDVRAVCLTKHPRAAPEVTAEWSAALRGAPTPSRTAPASRRSTNAESKEAGPPSRTRTRGRSGIPLGFHRWHSAPRSSTAISFTQARCSVPGAPGARLPPGTSHGCDGRSTAAEQAASGRRASTAGFDRTDVAPVLQAVSGS